MLPMGALLRGLPPGAGPMGLMGRLREGLPPPGIAAYTVVVPPPCDPASADSPS
jgi:hypothetical protein